MDAADQVTEGLRPCHGHARLPPRWARPGRAPPRGGPAEPGGGVSRPGPGARGAGERKRAPPGPAVIGRWWWGWGQLVLNASGEYFHGWPRSIWKRVPTSGSVSMPTTWWHLGHSQRSNP